MKENKKIINSEYILDILSSGLISIAIIYFLSSTGFSIFFAPIPFIVLAVKYGYIESSIAFMISSIISMFLIDFQMAIYNSIVILIISITISYMINTKKSLQKILIYISLLSFMMILITLGLVYIIKDINPIIIIKDTFMEAIDSFGEILKNDINFTANESSEYIIFLKEMVGYIISVLPSLVLISSLVIAITNTLISISILKRTGLDIYNNIKINNTNIVKEFRPLLSLIGLIFISAYFIKFENSDLIINNLSTIMIFVLFLNGVLLLDYAMEKRFNIVIRFIILFLFIFILQSYSIIAIIGLLDGIMDFRKRIEAQRHEK